MDCRQALHRLYHYLDRELDSSEYMDVEQHLRNCKGCFGKAEFERIMKEVVKDRCQKERGPEHFKDRIMELIHQIDINSEKSESRPTDKDSPFNTYNP